MSELTKNQKRKQRLQNKKDESYLNNLIKENKKEPIKEHDNTQNEPMSFAPGTKVTVTREQIIDKAKQMWQDVKTRNKTNPEYAKLDESEKLEVFRKKLGYAPFMDEFPIVSKYMICLGQFRVKAFVKFLDKCERTQHPSAEKREKGYMEDQWVRRQADYVQYLWEECHPHHYSTAERAAVWQQTYEKLKGEFDDFRTMHKDIEEKVKEEKKELHMENVRELLDRVKSGTQSLSEENEKALLSLLHEVYVNKKDLNPEKTTQSKKRLVDEKGNAQITVIETVTEEQMKEIDPNYIPTNEPEDDTYEIVNEEIV